MSLVRKMDWEVGWGGHIVGVLEGALRMGLHSFGIGILWSLTRIRECYCTIDVGYAMLWNGEAYLISACLFFVLSWILPHFEKRKTGSEFP